MYSKIGLKIVSSLLVEYMDEYFLISNIKMVQELGESIQLILWLIMTGYCLIYCTLSESVMFIYVANE